MEKSSESGRSTSVPLIKSCRHSQCLALRHCSQTYFLFRRVLLLFVALLAIAVGVSGCYTRSMRIEQNAAFFQSLPESHQEIIKAGRITLGFTPEEVYLAWGSPYDKIISETSQGVRVTWIYTRTHTTTFYKTTRIYNPKRKRWEYEEEPHRRHREYVEREVSFVNGQVENWTLYEKGFPY